MSITKNLAKTLQEKFGFKDDDLKTPAHDAIMLWLDANLEKIVSIYLKRYWNTEEIRKIEEKLKELEKNKENILINGKNLDDIKNIENKIEKLKTYISIGQPPEKSIKIVKKIWERPIKAHNDFVIGFIDMEVICYIPELFCYSEYDFPKLAIDHIEYSLMLEVKTTIKSIGEVIRQIHLYKNYFRNYHNKMYEFIIVSPDDRYVDLLKSQDIGFVKCDCELPKAEIPSQGDLFGA
jgi:hypothetical protein